MESNRDIELLDEKDQREGDEHQEEEHPRDKKFIFTMIAFHILIFVFFAAFAEYADSTQNTGAGTVHTYYGLYQDVHVMIFIGFGLLMTFLRKHGFSSMGMTFLIGVQSILLGCFFNTVIHNVLSSINLGNSGELYSGHELKLTMTLETMITGDFAAGAVLISYGAMLGRLTPTQIMWMLFFELFFYATNEYVGVYEFMAVDMGGSMFVHTFGAYFGLAFSWMWGAPDEDETKDEASVYHSDMFAIIGSVFLWMFWPSFNGALAPEETHQQERVVINTVLSLCCSCSMTFLLSHVCLGKFDMVHIQNATLAGGVAIGTSSDLFIGPFAAIIIGSLAGILSTCGYVYLTPVLNRVGVYDVCGIHNLHGMPGVLGAIAGAIASSAAETDHYGTNLETIFEGRSTRTASEQGGYQMAALLMTLIWAVFGGIVSAVLVKLIASEQKKRLFNDADEWEVPLKEFGNTYFPSETNAHKQAHE